MPAMGQQFRLPSGYGAMIPCDDIFPPRVEYYVAAIDSSGAPNGTAGTAEAPLTSPSSSAAHFPAPTLPGSPCRAPAGRSPPPPRPATPARPAEPERGTADLGEPCQSNNDCRRGLRCGSNAPASSSAN
jgi:hypothetical protein